jgi:hypothetical protein
MDIDLFLASAEGRWTLAPPALSDEITRLAAESGIGLPSDYLEFLGRCNGGYGSLDVQPCYLIVWAADKVIEINRGYQIAEYVPGFFAFATSGGGEFFAFDMRGQRPWTVASIPFIPMDAKYALRVAASFSELLDHVEPGSDEGIPISD